MAKTRAYGSDAQLLAAFESTYGTAPDGSGGGVYTKLPFKSTDLSAEKPLGYDPLLGQGRNAQDPYYEAISDAGNIVVPLDLRNIGFWLKGLFGAPTTTGTGPYIHVFVAGADLPSLAVQIGHLALSPQKHFLHTGAKLGGISFEMARSGPANGTINVIAQGEASASTAKDATPLELVLRRFSQSKGAIKVGGTQLGSVTGGSFQFSNNLEAVETIRADGLIDGADETEATATGSVTIRYGTDSTLESPPDAETPVELEFSHTIPGVDGYALTWNMARVFLPKVKKSIDGPGGLQQTYDWRAAYDTTDDTLLTVTLVNDVGAY